MKKAHVLPIILLLSVSIKADDFNELRYSYLSMSSVAKHLQEVNKSYKIDHNEYATDTFKLAMDGYIPYEPSSQSYDITAPSITKKNEVVFEAVKNNKNFRLCEKMNYIAFDFLDPSMLATKCVERYGRYLLYFL